MLKNDASCGEEERCGYEDADYSSATNLFAYESAGPSASLSQVLSKCLTDSGIAAYATEGCCLLMTDVCGDGCLTVDCNSGGVHCQLLLFRFITFTSRSSCTVDTRKRRFAVRLSYKKPPRHLQNTEHSRISYGTAIASGAIHMEVL